MARDITRRRFIEGAGVLTLSLLHFRCGDSPEPAEKPGPEPAGPGAVPRPAVADFRDWEDVYRQRWRWDAVVKGTHHVINCVSACPFDLFVKDGIVLREEQSTGMEANNASLPDFNPRGCQKGLCFSQLMYGPSRLRHPLKRVGDRGGGQWKRISWDDALTEIADKIIEIGVEDGPECVVYDSGTANWGYGSESGEMAAFDILGSTQLDGWAAVGDMPLGAIMTWGLFNVDGTSDDYFHSDLVFLWLGNPSYTRIPDAHFLWEARYNGTKIVSVAPDYNASTIHCDQWVNLRAGTDSALALGMASAIVSEGLYRADFVKEQTDLPLLVRDDSGHFLRHSDVRRGGKDDVFYLWDLEQRRAREAPGGEGLSRSSRLGVEGMDPALEGTFEVKLAGGKRVRVRPVFELLKRRLARYTPEMAAEITGVSADVIRELGREFARAKAVSIFGSWGMMKHHHSDLFQRGMILLLALTGNVGKRGAGLHVGAWYMLSGIETILSQLKPSWIQKLLVYLFEPTVREMIAQVRRYEDEHMYMNVPALLFLYEHAGLKDVVAKPEYHDPEPGIPLREAVEEALDRGVLPLYPKRGKKPRMYLHTRVNPLRRWPMPQLAEKNLWPQLDLVVGINLKMSSTCANSDIVLPACGYYERRGIKYAQSYLPYYVVGDKAVEPIGEAKSEWEIAGLLMKKIQERAREKGTPPVKDVKNRERDLKRAYDRWTQGGKFDENDDLLYYQLATSRSPEIGNISWEEAVQRGAVRIRDLGPFRTYTNICSDYEPGDSVYSCQWFVQKKQPWPTLTGRMQFYLDHDWFLAAEEELPTHKEMPKVGGDYPLRLIGGHTRWSIHSTFRDQVHMLRLQRGEPVACVSDRDAALRGVAEGGRIRIFNDEGEFELIAKISPSVQPGTVILYHAWENFQFAGWKGNQEPVPSAWKSLHMAEYGQLHYRFLYGGPHHAPRGTAVDFARA